MPVYWLDEHTIAFPHPEQASPEGILAVGGDLSPQRLVLAYQHGIFPWYSDPDPILWWSPDPRFVLFPDDLKVQKSMRPYFNQQKYTVTFDHAFEQVINACQKTSRPGQFGTWITEAMRLAYIQLHELGIVHSVEVWQGTNLVGGLYGLALGRVFFGESMFAHAPNASKFGFITLVRTLKARQYRLIDCQQETNHLASLGATSIKRSDFLEALEPIPEEATDRGSWRQWSPVYWPD